MAENPEMTLRKWAGLTGPLMQQSERHPSFSLAFAGLIEKAMAIRKGEFLQLEEIVRQSDDRLRPLGEPMKQDFGLHRWLAGAREEAYSDWLQWLFTQMSGEDLANVLSLPMFEPAILGKQVCVKREISVQHGHEGRLGRLDILINLADRVVVVLEVKLGSTSESDTAKQEGYFRSTESEFAHMERHYVLLVTEEDKEAAVTDGERHKFSIRTYPRFCRNLHRLAKTKLKDDQTLFVAALILMVAAAIETNLLQMSSQERSFTATISSHLLKFLERTDYE